MIQLNIGVPGSGKTYFVVKQIVDFASDKNTIYKKIITNINGLKLDDLSVLNSNIKFEQLDYEDLDFEAQKEFNFYIDNKKLDNYDDEVKKQGILSNYYDSLIVIDECHTLLSSDEHIKRLITYHRHWNIDFILITQDKNALDKVYLRNVETMISAVAPAKRFVSFGFRYVYYSSTQEYVKNTYQTKTIFLSKKISKYYDSGSTKLSRSQVLKFLIPVIFGFIGMYFFYNNFISTMFSNDKKSDVKENNQTRVSISSVPAISDPIQNVQNYIKISCYKNGVCTIKDNTYTFHRVFLDNLIKHGDCTLKYTQTSFGVTDNVFKCNSDFNSIIGVLNDKKIDTNINTNKLF
ncbi:MAG: zonular occludens toxin domain-containing protein [Sulfurovaceae bacterium]